MHKYEIENQNLHKQIENYTNIINNYESQQNTLNHLQHIIKRQNKIIKNQSNFVKYYHELQNPLSYQQWIKGIGSTKLSNDGFSEVCVVPNVDGFELSEKASKPKDPQYSILHSCVERKFTTLIDKQPIKSDSNSTYKSSLQMKEKVEESYF